MKVEINDALVDTIFIEELKVQYKKAAKDNNVNLTLAVCTILKEILTEDEYVNWVDE